MKILNAPTKLFASGLLVAAGALAIASPASAGKISGCSVNGKQLKGKVQVVTSFPDVKVQVVSSFPDINVKKVSSSPSSCGEWQFVSSQPDFKVQFVTSFPDIKVKYVNSSPGVN